MVAQGSQFSLAAFPLLPKISILSIKDKSWFEPARSALECGSSSYRLLGLVNTPLATREEQKWRQRSLAVVRPDAAGSSAAVQSGHLTAVYEDEKAVAAATALQRGFLWLIGLTARCTGLPEMGRTWLLAEPT